MGEETDTPVRRVSSIVLIVIIVVLILSVSALYQAFVVWSAGGEEAYTMGYYLLIGFIGLAFSTYMLVQTRTRMKRFTLKEQPVTTTLVCSKCDFKNVRNFERGDYILKEVGPCTRCDGKMTISAIYRELKEKPKEEKVFT